MERGEREKINEWKINRKALDPSYSFLPLDISDTHRELSLPVSSAFLSLLDSELMDRY